MKTIAEFIKILETKDPTEEVEFIVCKTDGEIVAVDVQKQAQPIIKMLKFFK